MLFLAGNSTSKGMVLNRRCTVMEIAASVAELSARDHHPAGSTPALRSGHIDLLVVFDL
jgi:hypothetical protein